MRSLFDIEIFEIWKYFLATTKILIVTSKELYRSGNLKESQALWKHYSAAFTRNT